MRGQSGQVPRKSDIGPSSGSPWENHPNCPNCPNCPAQDVGIGLRIQRPDRCPMSAPVDRNSSKIFEEATDD